jgi:Spy/CpxP family protein refolding chaperone
MPPAPPALPPVPPALLPPALLPPALLPPPPGPAPGPGPGPTIVPPSPPLELELLELELLEVSSVSPPLSAQAKGSSVTAAMSDEESQSERMTAPHSGALHKSTPARKGRDSSGLHAGRQGDDHMNMLNNTSLAVLFSIATGVATVGCASESAPESDAPAAEAERAEGVESYRDHRGYQIATHRIDRVLEEISATDGQRAKANEIKDRFAERLFSMKDDGKDVRAEVLEEWKKSEPDAEAMHALVDERVDVYRKLLHDLVDGGMELHAELTTEQRATIAEMAEERMKRHE